MGAGGQATIFRPSRFPGLLYKEYLTPLKVNAQALNRLRRARQQMTERDREFLDETAAWPAVIIEENGKPVGFLMAPAGDHFFHDFGRAGHKPTDLQFLIHQPKAAWRSVLLPGPYQRLEICLLIASAVDMMHRSSLIIGDISMSNILWAVRPGPAVYVIDCDGVRPAGGQPVLYQVNTPDWADPKDPNRATFDTDRYKLALAIVRVLAVDSLWKPGQAIRPIPWLSKAAQTELKVTTDQIGSGSRPDAAHWMELSRGFKASSVVFSGAAGRAG